MELVLLFSSPVHFNTFKYFSLEQDPLWFLTPAGLLPTSPFARVLNGPLHQTGTEFVEK